MAWARNGTPDTLSGAGDTMTISDMTAYKFNVFFYHAIASGNLDEEYIRLDNNSNSDYALRFSTNGASDLTNINNAGGILRNNQGHDNETFAVVYCINIDGEEKLAISNWMKANTAGAGNTPTRYEQVGKCDTSTNSGQFTRIDAVNASGSGDYAAGSNLTALTGDETESVSLQDGTIFEETDTNKAYIWNSSAKTWTQL